MRVFDTVMWAVAGACFAQIILNSFGTYDDMLGNVIRELIVRFVFAYIFQRAGWAVYNRNG